MIFKITLKLFLIPFNNSKLEVKGYSVNLIKSIYLFIINVVFFIFLLF